MKILSLDISSNQTGWAAHNGHEIVFGSFKTPKEGKRLFFYRTVKALIIEHSPEIVVIEGIASINYITALVLAEFRGVAKLACEAFSVLVIEYTATELKKHFGILKDPLRKQALDKKRLTKAGFPQKKTKTARQIGKQLMIEKTQERVTDKIKNDDEADALGLLFCYLDRNTK